MLTVDRIEAPSVTDVPGVARLAAARFGFSDAARLPPVHAHRELDVPHRRARARTARAARLPAGRPAGGRGAVRARVAAGAARRPRSDRAGGRRRRGRLADRRGAPRPPVARVLLRRVLASRPATEPDEDALGAVVPAARRDHGALPRPRARPCGRRRGSRARRGTSRRRSATQPYWGPWHSSVPDPERARPAERLATRSSRGSSASARATRASAWCTPTCGWRT